MLSERNQTQIPHTDAPFVEPLGQGGGIDYRGVHRDFTGDGGHVLYLYILIQVGLRKLFASLKTWITSEKGNYCMKIIPLFKNGVKTYSNIIL